METLGAEPWAAGMLSRRDPMAPYALENPHGSGSGRVADDPCSQSSGHRQQSQQHVGLTNAQPTDC